MNEVQVKVLIKDGVLPPRIESMTYAYLSSRLETQSFHSYISSVLTVSDEEEPLSEEEDSKVGKI